MERCIGIDHYAALILDGEKVRVFGLPKSRGSVTWTGKKDEGGKGSPACWVYDINRKAPKESKSPQDSLVDYPELVQKLLSEKNFKVPDLFVLSGRRNGNDERVGDLRRRNPDPNGVAYGCGVGLREKSCSVLGPFEGIARKMFGDGFVESCRGMAGDEIEREREWGRALIEKEKNMVGDMINKEEKMVKDMIEKEEKMVKDMTDKGKSAVEDMMNGEIPSGGKGGESGEKVEDENPATGEKVAARKSFFGSSKK